MPTITLITGIMAAGKSTVAEAVARQLSPSVHLRGDIFRRMIVSGREEMRVEPSEEAVRQLDLRYRLAVEAAKGYHAAGFHVVYQDVILGPSLTEVVELFGEVSVDVVVLCPQPGVVARREAGRAKTGYGGFEIEELDRAFRETTPRIGRWIDSSDLAPEETARRILAPGMGDVLI